MVFIIAIPSKIFLKKSTGFFKCSKELTSKHGMTLSIYDPFHTTFLPRQTNSFERVHQIPSK
jgi:hypothetical protein